MASNTKLDNDNFQERKIEKKTNCLHENVDILVFRHVINDSVTTLPVTQTSLYDDSIVTLVYWRLHVNVVKLLQMSELLFSIHFTFTTSDYR